MQKVLITGSEGMLGSEMCQFYEQAGVNVYGVDIKEADVTKKDEIISLIVSERPDVVIHCAGYTNVDGCENNEDYAYKVNVQGTKNVCLACEKLAIPIVYFSTDYVFDGKKGEPYIESDTPRPLNIYGKTKLAGERNVKELLKKYYIVRTSWLCGHNGKNFIEKILELSKTKKKIEVVDDQVGSPTFTEDLIKEMNRILKSGTFGIYHITNNGICSWFEFASKIIEYAGISGLEISPVKTEQSKRKAARPRYSKLRNYMLEQTIGNEMNSWEEGLSQYLA